MATVSKNIANCIIANEGWYPGDHIRAAKVVQYNNQFDSSLAYGIVYQGENLYKYESSPACHNVKVLWSIEKGFISKPD